MPEALRDLARLAATLLGWLVFVCGCLVWGALVVPATLLLARPWPGVVRRFSALTSAALRLYIRSLLFLRVRVERAGPRLRGPRILVANHQSWLDPIVLIGLEPGISGPATGYMFRVPVVGSVLRLAGFYPSDREGSAPVADLHRSAATTSESGGSLLFFPEGSRSRTGEIGAFQRGAFRAAVDQGLPIQPVVIDGLDRVLPPGCLIAQTRGRHLVRVRYLEPIEPPFGSGVRREVVRALAERVRDLLTSELAELRGQRPGASAVEVGYPSRGR